MALLVVLALASLAGLLADASIQTSHSFRWAVHSATVIETTEQATANLREAGSGQRGFVLTRDPAYARTFDARVAARSERELQVANAELQRNADRLRERGDMIELLGGMAHRMQAARTDEELAQVVEVFVLRLLPGLPGVLYAHNNSRNLLVPLAGWGGMGADPNGFAPDGCWALRRGQSHCATTPGRDIVCGHAADGKTYHCEPLLAGGGDRRASPQRPRGGGEPLSADGADREHRLRAGQSPAPALAARTKPFATH